MARKAAAAVARVALRVARRARRGRSAPGEAVRVRRRVGRIVGLRSRSGGRCVAVEVCSRVDLREVVDEALAGPEGSMPDTTG